MYFTWGPNSAPREIRYRMALRLRAPRVIRYRMATTTGGYYYYRYYYCYYCYYYYYYYYYYYHCYYEHVHQPGCELMPV